MYQRRLLERLENPRETVVDGQDEAIVYDNAVGNVCVVLLNFQVEHSGFARHRFDGLDQVGSVANVHRLATQGERPRCFSGIFRDVHSLETGHMTELDREFEQLSHEPFVRQNDGSLVHVHSRAIPVCDASKEPCAELCGGGVNPGWQFLTGETAVELRHNPLA